MAIKTITYDDVQSQGSGFIYVRQPRSNGYGYIAVRNAWNHEPYGTFK